MPDFGLKRDVSVTDWPLLYSESTLYSLARWPTAGWARISAVLEAPNVKTAFSKKAMGFIAKETLPASFRAEPGLVLHGYWSQPWADEWEKILSVDIENGTIALASSKHPWGYRTGQWFYVANAISQLDAPGKWAFDPKARLLFVWPNGDKSQLYLAKTPTLIELDGVNCVNFEGFRLEGARNTALRVVNSTQCSFRKLSIRNIGYRPFYGSIHVQGGRDIVISDTDITDVGGSAITLNGGDRKTLEPGGHEVLRCSLKRFQRIQQTFTPGIDLKGVGLRVADCTLTDAPHSAIWFAGNEHRIVNNEISNVVQETNDAGAIYAGRDWTARGNIVRGNFLHDFGGCSNRGLLNSANGYSKQHVSGIYLDDMFSSAKVENNLFVRVTQALFIGGGHDNIVRRNIFIDCSPAIELDARGLNGWKYMADSWLEQARKTRAINGIAFTSQPYALRYPRLKDQIKDNPGSPSGTAIYDNTVIGGSLFDDSTSRKARDWVYIRRNSETPGGEDPGVDCFDVWRMLKKRP